MLIRTTLEPAVLSGQWEKGERKRVPTPMSEHRSLNRNKDTGKSFKEEPRERKHRKKDQEKKNSVNSEDLMKVSTKEVKHDKQRIQKILS